ncbi:electron transfer flavoprotein subunit beta/FixA family protein [Thermodesulfobacteriota bacterium]
MNIAVCIKQVPDAPSIRMDTKRMTIIREGMESIINPLDYVALEAARDLREKDGGKITVLSMGPPQSEEALREALAYGADQVILLSDPDFAGADTLATSHVLARALSQLNPFPDVVLCGRQTIDSDTGHVGPQIAEELDLPQVCGVNEINIEEDSLLVRRLSDGFLHTIRVSMPALLTVSYGLEPPRHVPFGDLEAAFSNGEVILWGRKELNLEKKEIGFDGSATQVWKIQKPPPRRSGEIVTGSAQALSESLIAKLEALSILDEESGDNE